MTSKSRYNKLGFTFPVNNKEQYHKLIEGKTLAIKKEDLELAKIFFIFLVH